MMEANGSKTGKKAASLFGKALRSKLVALGLVFLFLAPSFAAISLSHSGFFQAQMVQTAAPSPDSNELVYTTLEWNVTAIGTTAAVSISRGVVFDDDFVFWRVINSTDFVITAFSLGGYTFRDLWDSDDSITGCPGDMKVIDNSIFASYGYEASDNSVFNTTIIESTELNTWAQYCFSDTVSPESLAQYTGPGPYNGMIVYGGCSGDTWSSIRAWNSTSNSEIDLFDGTYEGSDDVCFLTMFNSTCMIGGDCCPSNIIYTNDGQNWTDEYSPSELIYTSQYPFVWGWAVYVGDGTAYVAEENSQYGFYGLYSGGVMTWNGVGTTAAFNYNMLVESISNGLIGGCGGLWTSGGDYGGAAVLYQYNPDGTLGALVWSSSYNGTVKDLTYDPDGGAWYAMAFCMDSQNLTILRIT